MDVGFKGLRLSLRSYYREKWSLADVIVCYEKLFTGNMCYWNRKAKQPSTPPAVHLLKEEFVTQEQRFSFPEGSTRPLAIFFRENNEELTLGESNLLKTIAMMIDESAHNQVNKTYLENKVVMMIENFSRAEKDIGKGLGRAYQHLLFALTPKEARITNFSTAACVEEVFTRALR